MVLVVAAITVGGADLLFRRISPPKYVREVADAVAEYEHEDPTTLVFGSSHARTFAVMDGIVRERTQGQERILAVPVEWGKFRSYEWVLHHRIEPFIDAKDDTGAKKRPSLKRFILLTAWWDTCWMDGDPPVFNVPSRAWTFKDFFADVLNNGITNHNRNYVTSRWQDLWRGSILVSDRGQEHLVAALRERVKPLSTEAKERQYENKLEGWRSIMVQGKKCLSHRDELASADRILQWALGRGYDVTLMLYPMMPITMTDDTRANVQAPFQESMRKLALRHNVRFVDATFEHGGIVNEDFADFDHLTPAGHLKFSKWLLSDKNAFLLTSPAATRAPTPVPSGGATP